MYPFLFSKTLIYAKIPPGSENKSQIQRESVVLYFTSFDREISTFRPCQVLQELREPAP